jgi:hypothetical protein
MGKQSPVSVSLAFKHITKCLTKSFHISMLKEYQPVSAVATVFLSTWGSENPTFKKVI